MTIITTKDGIELGQVPDMTLVSFEEAHVLVNGGQDPEGYLGAAINDSESVWRFPHPLDDFLVQGEGANIARLSAALRARVDADFCPIMFPIADELNGIPGCPRCGKDDRVALVGERRLAGKRETVVRCPLCGNNFTLRMNQTISLCKSVIGHYQGDSKASALAVRNARIAQELIRRIAPGINHQDGWSYNQEDLVRQIDLSI